MTRLEEENSVLQVLNGLTEWAPQLCLAPSPDAAAISGVHFVLHAMRC